MCLFTSFYGYCVIDINRGNESFLQQKCNYELYIGLYRKSNWSIQDILKSVPMSIIFIMAG